ncbi:hypothetical protein N5T96_06750 [Aliarcobacter butzleri]|uniref:hypothetical protein n=1 Tax=Aliarcobacter butzleri TaxID=28197 RepID=UPI0021B2D31F|nr:hypothetical protein [Aliarcobacter butzleri]MCT7566036.1 hypothetical protein [Aliarcobacter butzleri]MCT7573386.1 hypothetical protein [Aliarcobacter butzleri]
MEKEELIKKIDEIVGNKLREIFNYPNGYEIYKKSIEAEALLDLVSSLKLNINIDSEKRKKLKELKSTLLKEV